MKNLIPIPIAFFAIFLQAKDPLTTLEYKILGVQLRVTPEVLSVPKGIAGSIAVDIVAGDGTEDVPSVFNTDNTIVEATLRGPSFEARRLVGLPNQPLLLPPLFVVGDYQLDNIRLIDEETGEVRLEGTPNNIPVRVFDEVLISRVTSRPLTLNEIQEKGIVIDEQNFRAVEFEVGFVLDGKRVPVKFPVVAPSFEQTTEIIPDAEVNELLVQAELINQELAINAELPPELETANLNIQIKPINFQLVMEGEQDLALKIPPIPALVVIPGNIGFLNQFFSVQIFTENGSPEGSNLSVHNLQGTMVLPTGNDRVAGSFEEPGDDPLRFARVGDNAEINNVLPIRQPGADGELGTTDDVDRLQPGETGQAEFLVEGLLEGLHVMDINLTAELEGLAAGAVEIEGKASGSVLVRNPKFSFAFSHPRTIRAGEPYTANVTVLNTSDSPANLVNVTLAQNSLSGGLLESAETVELGTINPGETAIAAYRVRAQRTGSITFSNLTTGDDSLIGRFRLSMGIDERGVALSPDTIIMPDYVDDLPENLITAANRILGQALSVATAPLLPAKVIPVRKSIITTRVVELAEAGQRLRYGDDISKILIDLLLDWQGARSFEEGFDQILRETEAGREFREAMMAEIEISDMANAAEILSQHASDLAGRSEVWYLFGVNDSSVLLSLIQGDNRADLDHSTMDQALGYRGSKGHWLITKSVASLTIQWQTSETIGDLTLNLVMLTGDGSAEVFEWQVSDVAAQTCFTTTPDFDNGFLHRSLNCDSDSGETIGANQTNVTENPPQVISVIQDIKVPSARPRPGKQCLAAGTNNYGTVLAVLFSKPMSQSTIDRPEAFVLDNENAARFVQIQPGGRVALLTMTGPVGTIFDRSMTISGISDSRGNLITGDPVLVQTTLSEGIGILGKVVRSDGSPASNIPVTLTMYDEYFSGLAGCIPFIIRNAQANTDEMGRFSFDMVLAGIPYSISATDTTDLSTEAIGLILESSSGDTFARQKLEELASQASVQNTLLEEFAVGALPQAIALAEGIDRAVLKDFVDIGSARIGTTVPVALQFRGRATITGTILREDGTVTVPETAVNLFPDPDSRELGRGVFSDRTGQFAFFGVPLGEFTIEAVAPTGERRIISDVVDTINEIKELTIVLTQGVEVIRTELQGRVLEFDNATPHPMASVFVGKFNPQTGSFGGVVAAVTTDADGYWTAMDIPVDTWDLVAVSFDGKRKGERRDIQAVDGDTTQVNLSLQGRATVVGRVENSIGEPVPNALVAGGEVLVRTDTNGFFTATGVPTGKRTINAGLERDPENGIDFPRLGSASLDVLPGIENSVVVRLVPAGRIVGRVLDLNGEVVPNVRVAIPQLGGFLWTEADENGNYKFENLALGQYTVSAPAPAAENKDTSGILEAVQSGSSEEILAAIGEAFTIFSGAADPFLNGDGESFNPQDWGFEKVNLAFDGQTVVADIRYLPSGTISGTILNGQGVPIGARVRLTGIGPRRNGDLGFIIRGERNSDPALGTFEFPGQALIGDWGLQAASPFFPTVISQNGQTSSVEPNATGLILQFPVIEEINGRLTGIVLDPDGNPVEAGVDVQISFGNDFIIRTDDNGRFDTQIDLPALDGIGRPGRGYSITARDEPNGFQGRVFATLFPGTTVDVEVPLIGRGDLDITVFLADGTPAEDAEVTVSQRGFPNDVFSDFSDLNGSVNFANLFEGGYSICASLISGPTTIYGRSFVSVPLNGLATATVTLAPTATIRGRFLQRDLTTPIPSAQITVGNLGFATTDANGNFEVAGLPLGTYTLSGNDPVNGLGASLSVALNFNEEIREVQLVERARGDIFGLVINSFGDNVVPGANVTISPLDGISLPRTVTSGPDGGFEIPGVPAGDFRIVAKDPTTGRMGISTGTLPENVMSFEVNIPLEPLAGISGIIFEPDGVTPATNATVTLSGPSFTGSADTDENGQVIFSNLSLGIYEIRAVSMTLSENRSVNETEVTLSQASEVQQFDLAIRGVGSITGQLLLSDGVSPAIGAQVDLIISSDFLTDNETTLTDVNGNFDFDNIPVGPYRLIAQSEAFGASFNGEIGTDGEADMVEMVLSASGDVTGVLVESEALTPVSGIEVLIIFDSQSGLPGRANAQTDENGVFEFMNIPVGPFDLEAIAPDLNGISRGSFQLSSNGEVLDLGNVILDQDDPEVIEVFPMNTATEVDTNVVIEMSFSEELALDSISDDGIYIRDSKNTEINATVELLPHPSDNALRLVRITPTSPLASEITYEIVVVDGDRKNAIGSVIARGPTDLVGRPLVLPFISSFTTADKDPPDLVSLTPVDGSIQVDISSVIRLSFDEPISEEGVTISLNGPVGAVPGATAAGLNGLILVFTPDQNLSLNSEYTVSIDGVMDLAGNLAENQPFSSNFATLDTLGPEISEVRLKNEASAIAGTAIEFEVVLVEPEDDVSVRFSVNLESIGQTLPGDQDLEYQLPLSGTIIVRAVAIDRFGNEGPFSEMTYEIIKNTPPEIVFNRLFPASGPVPTGSLFSVEVSANDDGGLAELRAFSGGALSVPVTTSDGETITLTGTVANDAVVGSTIIIFAEAIDNSGQSSGEQSIQFPISDGTAPVVVITAPITETILEPGEPFTVAVNATDNLGVSSLELTSTGLAVFDETRDFEPSQVSISESFELMIPSENNSGGTVTLNAQASDSVLNVGTAEAVILQVRRTLPWMVTSSEPTDGTINVSPLVNPFVVSDQPLDQTSVDASNFFLEDENDTPVDGTLEIVAEGTASRLSFIPEAPLNQNTDYELVVTTEILDVLGNPLANEFRISFKTAETMLVVHRPIADLVTYPENETIEFRATATPADLVDRILFSIDGTSVMENAGSGSAILPASTTDNPVDMTVTSFSETGEQLLIANSSLKQASRNPDTDGDGVTDDVESSQGTSPSDENDIPFRGVPATAETVMLYHFDKIDPSPTLDLELNLDIQNTGDPVGEGYSEFKDSNVSTNPQDTLIDLKETQSAIFGNFIQGSYTNINNSDGVTPENGIPIEVWQDGVVFTNDSFYGIEGLASGRYKISLFSRSSDDSETSWRVWAGRGLRLNSSTINYVDVVDGIRSLTGDTNDYFTVDFTVDIRSGEILAFGGEAGAYINGAKVVHVENSVVYYRVVDEVAGREAKLFGDSFITVDGLQAMYDSTYHDGFRDWIRIDSPGQMDEGTIEFWVKPLAASGHFLTIGAELGGRSDWLFIASESGILKFGIWHGFWSDGNNRVVTDVNMGEVVNEWHHVSVNWGPDGMRVFFDYELRGTATNTGSLSAQPAILLAASSWGGFGHCMIDEFRILNIQRDPLLAEDGNPDSDSDLLSDIQEFNMGLDPGNPDTDGDNIIDGIDSDPFAPNDASPVFGVIADSFTIGLSITQRVSFTVTDGDGDIVEISLESADAGVELPTSIQLANTGEANQVTVLPIDPPSGDFSADLVFTGNISDIGTWNLKLSAKDVGGRVAEYTFALTIESVEGAPTIDAIADRSMAEQEVLSVPILAFSSESRIKGIRLADGAPFFAYIQGFVQTEENGEYTATAELVCRPMFDDAGEYDLLIQVRDLENRLAQQSFHLTVSDDPNLMTTSWVNVADGDWNDEANWSAGVPNDSTIAVIDASGAPFTIANVAGKFGGLIVDSDAVSIHISDSSTINGVTQIRQGNLLLNSPEGALPVIQFAGGLINKGTLSIDEGVTIRGAVDREILADDLVAYWPFEGNANDQSGNGRNGSLRGSPEFVNGEVGQALNFDGDSDYVIINSFSDFPSDEISVSFWMNTDDRTKAGSPISYAHSSNNNAFLISNYRDFNVSAAGNSTNRTRISANDGNWHQITCTWQSETGEVRLYKDGFLEISRDFTQGLTIPQGGALVFAQEQDSVGGTFDVTQAFKGLLDEVRLYDRALTEQEIQNDFVNQRGFVPLVNRGIVEANDSNDAKSIRFLASIINDSGGVIRINDNVRMEMLGKRLRSYGALEINPSSELILTEGFPKSLILGPETLSEQSTSLSGSGTLQFLDKNTLVLEADVEFGSVAIKFEDRAEIQGQGNISNDSNGALTIATPISLSGSIDLAGELVVEEPVTIDVMGNITLRASSMVTNQSGALQYSGALNDEGVTLTGNAPVSMPTAPVSNSALFVIEEEEELNDQLTAESVTGTPTFSIVSNAARGNAVLTDQETGAFTYTPNQDVFGLDFFTFKVMDDIGGSNVATATVEIKPVNDAPTVQDETVAGSEDEQLLITLNGLDVDNDPLTFSITSLPMSGRIFQAVDDEGGTTTLGVEITEIPTSVMNSEGKLIFLPGPNAFGNAYASFTYLANDFRLDSEERTISIDILPINDPPIAGFGNALSFDGIDDAVHAEDPSDVLNIGSQSWTTSAWIRSSVEATERQSIISRYECGWNNCSTPDGNVNAFYALELSENGFALFRVRSDNAEIPVAVDDVDLRDGNWHHVVGVLDRDAGLLRIIVDGREKNNANSEALNSINDAGSPLSIGHTFIEGWDTPIRHFLGTIDEVRVWNVARTVSEINEDRYRILNGNESGLVGYWRFDEGVSDTTLDLAPNVNYGRLGFGESDRMPVWTDGAAPVIAEGVKNSDLVVTLFGADPESDLISAEVTSLPSQGALFQAMDDIGGGISKGSEITSTMTVVTDSEMRVIFEPNVDVVGNPLDSFNFVINDGEFDSSEKTVTITTLDVNTPPVANDASVDVDEDTELTIPLPGSDADSSVVSAFILSLPDRGTLYQTSGDPINTVPILVTDRDNQVVFIPSQNEFDSPYITFDFFVNDGRDDSNQATITVNVLPIDDAPIANNDGYATDQDTELIIPVPGVLENDIDVDGDTLTAELVDDVLDGTLVFNPDGSFTYMPPTNFFGTASFTYKTIANSLESQARTVMITVLPFATVFWTNANGGNWNTPENWSTGAVPVTGDKVAITLNGNYTVTLDTHVTIGSLIVNGASGSQILATSNRTLTIDNQAFFGENAVLSHNGGGTINGSGDITIFGNMNFRSSTLSGSGSFTTLLGTTTLAAHTNDAILSGRIWDNFGVVNFTGDNHSTDFSLSSNSIFNNQPGAEFNLDNSHAVARIFGSGTFNNEGTVNKISDILTQIHPIFNNSGAVNVVDGTLRLDNDGTDTGTYVVSTDKILQFSVGTRNLNSGAMVEGEGSFSVSGGTVNCNSGSDLPVSGLNLTNGTIAFNTGQPQTFSNLSVTSGTLTGADDVTVTEAFIFRSATITGSGKLITAAGSTTSLAAHTNDAVLSGRTWDNFGVVNFTGDNHSTDFSLSTNSIFNNQPGAEFNLDNSHAVARIFGSGTFNNEGTVNKISDIFTEIDPLFHNNGIVNIMAGTLRLDNDGDDTGTYSIESNNILEFRGGTRNLDSGAMVEGEGSFSVSGGTVNFNSGSDLPVSRLNVTGGTLSISTGQPQTFSAGSVTGGTLTGEDDVTVTEAFIFRSATISGSGKLITAAGSTTSLAAHTNDAVLSGRTWDNFGVVNFTGDNHSTDFSLSTNSIFNNKPGAEFNLDNSHAVARIFGSGTFNNEGTVHKISDIFIEIDPLFHNNGIVNIIAGTLRLDNDGDDTGTYSIESNNILEFRGGTRNLNSGAMVEGEGSFGVSGGTVNFNSGSDLPVSRLNVTGGTLSISTGQPQTFSAGSVTGGTLTGEDDVTFIQAFSFRSATISGSGKLITAAGSTTSLAAHTNDAVLSGRTWDNFGVVNFTGDNHSTDFSLSTNSIFNNKPGAEFNLDNSHAVARIFGSGTFNNEGTVNKISDIFTEIDPLFHNNGIVNIMAGTLRLDNGGDDTGTYVVAADEILQFDSGARNMGATSTISGDGIVRFTGGIVSFSDNQSTSINSSKTFLASDGILSVGIITQPTNGIVNDNGDGTLTYMPTQGFEGTDDFSFVVNGETGSANAAVMMTVGGNDLVGNSLTIPKAFVKNALVNVGNPDERAPDVLWSYPGFLRANVDIDSSVIISFSEPMDTDKTESAFALVRDDTSIPGSFKWTDYGIGTNSVLLFTPETDLEFDTEYSFRVSIEAVDLDMEPKPLVEDYHIVFITGSDPDMRAPRVDYTTPHDAETGVPSAVQIEIGFSESMNRESVETAFTLRRNGIPVTGSFDWIEMDGFSPDRIVIFTPETPLFHESIYTVTIAGSATDQDSAPKSLAEAFQSTFSTASDPGLHPPGIAWTIPNHGTENIAVSSQIIVNFTESMNRDSVETAFSFTDGNEAVDGSFTWKDFGNGVDSAFVFSPTGLLEYSAAYTVRIQDSAMDLDEIPRSLSNALVVEFTTSPEPGNTIPEIISIFPWDGATDIWPDVQVTIKFSKTMEANTVEGAFTITHKETQGDVLGTFHWFNGGSGSNSTVTFVPDILLDPGSDYEIVIESLAVDEDGISIDIYSSSFKTTAQEAPSVINVFPDGSVSVSINAPIIVEFSESMDRQSTSSAFELRKETELITGGVTWDNFGNGPDSVFIFTPESVLQGDTTYTMTVNSSASDLDSPQNTLAESVTKIFHTEIDALGQPPLVEFTKPADGDQFVWHTSSIEIGFSMSMDLALTENALVISNDFGEIIDGRFTWFPSDRGPNSILLFEPDTLLEPDMNYRLEISTLARNIVAQSQPLLNTFIAEFTVDTNRLQLDPGWNLVSIPSSSEKTVGELFSDGQESGNLTGGLLWSVVDSQLEPHRLNEPLVPQRAYWVYNRFPEVRLTQPIDGDLTNRSFSVQANTWQTLAPSTLIFQADFKDEFPIWTWQGGQFCPLLPDEPLERFRGYFFYDNQNRELKLQE